MKTNRIIILLLIISIFTVSGCELYADPAVDDNDDTAGDNDNEQPQVKGEGRVIFGVTDLGLDTDSVTSFLITIDKIEAHNNEKGWINVMERPTTVDLIALDKEDAIRLLADLNLESGTYQQFRLVVSKIIIREGGDIKTAILPSSELKIVGDLNVNVDEISTAVFDFKVEDSMHIAGNGKYIFAPVIQFEARQNADVNIEDKKDGKVVKISNGNIDTNIEFGMDVDGNVVAGVKIPKDKKLTIKAGGEIVYGI